MRTVALSDPLAPDDTRGYWHGVDDIPPSWGRSVVTIGMFDGVHLGHRRLLERASDLGHHRDLPVVLTTFDPHPASVAGRPRDTTPVSTLDHRAELAREHGADAMLVLSFDEQLAATPAEVFVVDILTTALGATDVVIGENFRFGHRGAGCGDLLERLGHRHGFTTHAVPLLPGYSSTRVRELVGAGDLLGAAALLGRPHRVTGRLRHGRVDVGPSLLPPPGHYLARVGGLETRVEIRDRVITLDRWEPSGPIDIDLLARPAGPDT